MDAVMVAVMEAAVDGFKTCIQENEIRENTIIHAGQKYQFNRTSNKEFSTIFGKSVIERRLYQDENGESFVPLDHAWNMENQFATLEVREAVLFAQSLMPAREARQVFDKCATSTSRNRPSRRSRRTWSLTSKTTLMTCWKPFARKK